MNDGTRSAIKWAGRITALVILVGLIFLIFLCIESSITGKDKVKWHFWFQLFTGNWSSVPDEYNTRPLMTSLSMLLAFVLNLASFGLFGLIANQLAILRKVQAMKLVDMLRERDRSIKNSILASFFSQFSRFSDEEKEAMMDKVEQTFKDGDSVWAHQHLETIFGRQAALRLRRAIQRATIDPT